MQDIFKLDSKNELKNKLFQYILSTNIEKQVQPTVGKISRTHHHFCLQYKSWQHFYTLLLMIKKYLNTNYTFSKHLGYDLILITYKKVPKAKNQYETCNIWIFYNYTSNMWLYSNNSTEMLAVRFMSLSARLLIKRVWCYRKKWQELYVWQQLVIVRLLLIQHLYNKKPTETSQFYFVLLLY